VDALLYLVRQHINYWFDANTAKAREYLQKVIEAGAGKTRVAAFELAIANGLKKGEEEYLKAQKELKKKSYGLYCHQLEWAAKADHTEAQYELGKTLCDGAAGRF